MTTTERFKQALARILKSINQVDDLDLLVMAYWTSSMGLIFWGAFK